MKDKRKAGGGAGRYVASFFERVGELSDAQRHRAKKAFNGFSWPSGEPSKGSVRKQPRFSQFPNAPRKKSNRPAAERGRSRIANTKQRTCLFIAARLEMAFFLVLAAVVRSRVLAGDAVRRRDELKGKGRRPVAGAPGTVVSQMFQQSAPDTPSLTYVDPSALKRP